MFIILETFFLLFITFSLVKSKGRLYNYKIGSNYVCLYIYIYINIYIYIYIYVSMCNYCIETIIWLLFERYEVPMQYIYIYIIAYNKLYSS
jgi:hypothetical protein